MRLMNVVQGSPEWHQARLGMPTASQFDRIITPKTLKPSSQSQGYLCELLAERLLGVPLDSVATEWMARGLELEPQAVEFYEFTRDVKADLGGFALLDDGSAGCSPDRLIGDDGGLEIKCPAPATHVAYLLGQAVDEKYRCQVQGSLWITGRRWWDVLSYHPDMPPALVRVERDEEFIEALAAAVGDFNARLSEAWKGLLK